MQHPLLNEAEITLNVLRLDLPDPLISGNKWFKLHQYIVHAQQNGINTLLSFGGAWSNHIAALASAGEKYNLKTIGIIRGEPVRNITLDRAGRQGMKLHFVSRGRYREFRQQNFSQELIKEFGDCLVIPEGGKGPMGIQGASLISSFIPTETDYVFLPVGTGATMKGIALTIPVDIRLEGILAGRNEPEIQELMKENHPNHRKLHEDYAFGGFARITPALRAFTEDLSLISRIPFEPVYTGKMMYALFDLVEKGYFAGKSRITVIHTGGLQYQNS
jgi:1-aminocyclopropane-1-carboxylate deaminase